MHQNKLFLLLFLLLSLPDQPAWSQEWTNGSAVALLNCLEDHYGANDLLVNGRPYRPSNIRAARHPYFLTDEWTEGTVYVKGRTFQGAILKYDLETGQLVLKHVFKNGTSANIALPTMLVDSFRIGQHLFIDPSLLPGPTGAFAYLEKIYSGDFAFFRRHKKVFIASYSDRTPHGRFSETEITFFLLADGRLHEISNRKALLDFFAPDQKNVRKYLKRQGIRLGQASKDQLEQLMSYCDTLD